VQYQPQGGTRWCSTAAIMVPVQPVLKQYWRGSTMYSYSRDNASHGSTHQAIFHITGSTTI
jgi:hypothetical protein